jgi:hypothetical protein
MLVLELSHMTAHFFYFFGHITRREPLGCFHGTDNTGKKNRTDYQ